MKIFDPTIGALKQSLNLRTENENVIASNIANADTPGFRGKVLDFEGEMQKALDTTSQLKLETSDPGHLGSPEAEHVQGEVKMDSNGIESLDGNTVDRAAEMVRMKENQLLFNSSIEALKKKIGMLEYGITEGGGNR